MARADAGYPELVRDGSTEAEEAPARSVSPQRGMSPPQAHALDTPDPALQAVQTAIERRRLLEQVGGHGPQGHRKPSCALVPTRPEVPLQGLPAVHPGPDTLGPQEGRPGCHRGETGACGKAVALGKGLDTASASSGRPELQPEGGALVFSASLLGESGQRPA